MHAKNKNNIIKIISLIEPPFSQDRTKLLKMSHSEDLLPWSQNWPIVWFVTSTIGYAFFVTLNGKLQTQTGCIYSHCCIISDSMMLCPFIPKIVLLKRSLRFFFMISNDLHCCNVSNNMYPLGWLTSPNCSRHI